MLWHHQMCCGGGERSCNWPAGDQTWLFFWPVENEPHADCYSSRSSSFTEAPFTPNSDTSRLFGLSSTRKPKKLCFSKTPAKVEIWKNTTFVVFACRQQSFRFQKVTACKKDLVPSLREQEITSASSCKTFLQTLVWAMLFLRRKYPFWC